MFGCVVRAGFARQGQGCRLRSRHALACPQSFGTAARRTGGHRGLRNMKEILVGLAGLEPATFRPPDGRATRLRHSPTERVLAQKLDVCKSGSVARSGKCTCISSFARRGVLGAATERPSEFHGAAQAGRLGPPQGGRKPMVRLVGSIIVRRISRGNVWCGRDRRLWRLFHSDRRCRCLFRW